MADAGARAMRTNHVLIDYESVQPASLAALEQAHVRVSVFVGASQAKVSFEVADALQRMGTNAGYVRISGNGRNALDFHIAYYLGRLALTEPGAYFHIVSKDTGFDPLVAHLRSQGVSICRSPAIEAIPFVKVAQAQSGDERIAAVVDNLKARKAAKPRTLRTLSSTVGALFGKRLAEAEVADLLQRMQAQGLIAVAGARIDYRLPE